MPRSACAFDVVNNDQRITQQYGRGEQYLDVLGGGDGFVMLCCDITPYPEDILAGDHKPGASACSWDR